ncbi:hypothetical protein R6Q59_015183 [Mikania micrantha]
MDRATARVLPWTAAVAGFVGRDEQQRSWRKEKAGDGDVLILSSADRTGLAVIPWVNTNQPSSGSKDSKFSYGYASSAVDGKLVGLFGVFDDHGCSTQLARVAPGNQLQLKFVILHEAKGTYGRIKRVCETEFVKSSMELFLSAANLKT